MKDDEIRRAALAEQMKKQFERERKTQSGILHLRIIADNFDSGHVEALIRAFKWAWKQTYSDPQITSIKADFEEVITQRNHENWYWEGTDLKRLDKFAGMETDFEDVPEGLPRHVTELPRIGL